MQQPGVKAVVVYADQLLTKVHKQIMKDRHCKRTKENFMKIYNIFGIQFM